MSPDISSAILSTIRQLQDAISEGRIARAIELGEYLQRIDELLAEPQFTDLKVAVRRSLNDAIRYAARDIPKPPRVTGTINVMFDVLNPLHIEAVRGLETRVITPFREEIRDVLRAHIENGLRSGLGPRNISKGLRSVVGLAPNQIAAVENFEQALRDGKVGKALGYSLRDKRYGISKEMTEAQIQKAVDAYRKRFVSFHAETVARTATLETLKKGQQLAWQQAIDRGIVDAGRLVKRWIGVMDERERDSHRAMEGETVPFLGRYSNGQEYPGQNEFNCRCISRITEQRAQIARAA